MTKNIPTTEPDSLLTETIAVRLSEQDCRALALIAERDDRTISYIVRAQLRDFLRHQWREV